jgi:predicted nucleotidyltransferase
MSVIGFDEAFNNALMVYIDVGLKIRVVDHAGLFILKLYSWTDRSADKDAQDIRYVLDNYDRVISKTYYDVLNESDEAGASADKFGTYLLASDIKNRYPEIIDKISNLLEIEIKQNRLVSAMIKNRSTQDEEFPQIEDKLNTLLDLLKS